MILTPYSQHKAFSMITAIFVIILMGTVSVYVLNLAGKMTRETTAQYQNEQAILYAKSYTEFAIMAANTRDCINKITSFIGSSQQAVYEGKGYLIEVDVQYIGNEFFGAIGCNTLGGDIRDSQSEGGIILIDTSVKYRDLDIVDVFKNDGNTVNKTNLPWITYHRRSLQRL